LDTLITEDKENRLVTTYERNIDGQITKILDTYRDNTMLKEERFYTNGQNTKTKYYLGGPLSSFTLYEYDSLGVKTKEIIHSPNGEHWGHTEFSYAKNGKIAKRASYRKNGELSEYIEYVYDRKNRLQWETAKTKDEKPLSTSEYVYE
ncbi:MAG: hypothetical protein ACPGYY_07365, partial [Bacteroidia bacterium]